MTDVVVVAILSLIGTLIGSLGGILAANKLTNYRIEQLEKKVEKHNQVVERVYKLEKDEAVLQEEIEQLRGYHN
jgi:cell division protein FtsB